MHLQRVACYWMFPYLYQRRRVVYRPQRVRDSRVHNA